MERQYLHEDIRLIKRYFPGARTVSLRTPFDLTDRPVRRHYALPDTFQDDGKGSMEFGWPGDTVWSR